MTQIKKFLNFFIIILVAVYAGYFLFWDNGSRSQLQGQLDQSSTKNIDELVNKNLQEATRRMISEQANRKLLEQKAMDAAKNVKVSEYVDPDSRKPLEEQIHKADLGVAVQSMPKTSAPVYRELTVAEMNPAQRKEYARQYIENARKAGYHIELDENLEVKSATSIRQPSQSYDSVEIVPSN